MPLLTVNNLEQVSPLFRGWAGNALAKGVMRLLAVDKVNELYDRNAALKGPDFAAAVLDDIGMDYELRFEGIDPAHASYETLASLIPDGPFITISNHPCGHADGISLVEVFGNMRDDYKVIVNNILGMIQPLEDNFIQVTPTGSSRTAPTAASVSGIKAALKHLRSGGCLGLFPSGAVSDFSLKDRCVRDREWQEAVIRLIRKLNVPVVPVHFLDRNSNFYYSLGLIDWRVRLLRLPGEVFNKRGRVTRIALGEIIPPERMQEFDDIDMLRNFLRNKVYNQH